MTEGVTYERRLSGESIDVLKNVLGRSVCTFYSSHLYVMGRHVAAPELSLSLFDPIESVTVRADYFETPHTLTDYWQMHVHRQRYPHGVEVHPEIENVLYDQAIVFRRGDGKFFCMACHLNGPGIAQDIHYTDDDAVLSQLLEISRLRLTLNC